MLLLIMMTLSQQLAPAKPPSAGSILVATEKSKDPDLAHSVVLIFHSSSDGVMGLILNHPVEKSKYFGGPIPIGTRTLARTGGEKILDGVYLGPSANGRVYSGYVGWSPQQLIDEISRNLWKVRPGSSAIVFDPRPETLWRRLILN